MILSALHHPSRIALLILVASILPIAGALIGQYGFGLHPCHLCILQRIPYGLAAVLGMLALLWPAWRAHMRWVLAVASVLWLADAGIAFYHVGVEQGWWHSGCTAKTGGMTLEELRAAIAASPLVSCNQVAFHFLGLSMAGWNVLYGLGCALMGAWLTKKIKV